MENRASTYLDGREGTVSESIGTSLRHTVSCLHPSVLSECLVLCSTPFSTFLPSPSGTNVLGYGPRFSRRASYKWPLHAGLKRIYIYMCIYVCTQPGRSRVYSAGDEDAVRPRVRSRSEIATRWRETGSGTSRRGRWRRAG